MWLTIRTKNMPRNVPHIIVGIIYFPPASDSWQMTEHILHSIDTITAKHPNAGILVIGDFNQMRDATLKSSLRLNQIVKYPTRGRNTLDKIYSNMDDLFTSEVIDGIQNSDHKSVLCYANGIDDIKTKETAKYTIEKRNQSHTRKCLLTSELRTKRWDLLYQLPTCQEQFDYIYAYLQDLLNTYIPIRKEVKNRNDKPWITKYFKEILAKRQRAWKEGKTWLYNIYRNRSNREAKRLKRQYYENNIEQLRKSNPRNWWKATKVIIGGGNNDMSSFKQILNDQYDNNIGHMTNELITYI